MVYRLDRLARDLILQETLVQRLRDQETPVRSATEPDLDTDTDDPTKVLIRQIIGAVSQYERAVIRGRMMAGKAAKREAGGYVGGTVAYGWQLEDGQVVLDPDEQKVGQLVARMASRRVAPHHRSRAGAGGLPAAGRGRLAPEHGSPHRSRLHSGPCRSTAALLLTSARQPSMASLVHDVGVQHRVPGNGVVCRVQDPDVRRRACPHGGLRMTSPDAHDLTPVTREDGATSLPRRGYSWPPFEPGHTLSVRHGTRASAC